MKISLPTRLLKMTLLSLTLGVTVVAVGCGAATRDIDSVKVDPVATPLAKILDEAAERGSLGSGYMDVEMEINKLPNAADFKDDLLSLQKADGNKAEMKKVVDAIKAKIK